MEAEHDSMSKFLPFSGEPAFLEGCSLTIADHFIHYTIMFSQCYIVIYSVIFMCQPLFSTDIHLPQCTPSILPCFVYSLLQLYLHLHHFCDTCKQNHTCHGHFVGLASRNPTVAFFPIHPRRIGAEFIAATGGHRWEHHGCVWLQKAAGVMDRSPKNNNFWCGKLLEMSGQPLGFEAPYPWRCLL